MVSFGYKLMAEEHTPNDLVRNAVRAEELGFEFVSISDHYHPWLNSQEHSSFAWSVLGAIAARTERIGLGPGLTCPIVRYHPAIVAQAAATVAVMSGGRLTLQLGAGERLNEHVVGYGWPAVSVRHEMLGEAIDIIRLLWQGGYQSYEGQHFTLEDARVFDLPERTPTIAVGISGAASAKLAATKADGIVATEPKPDLVEAYTKAGGAADAPKYCEVSLCYAADQQTAAKIAHERMRFGLTGWKVQAELPNPVNFEAATAFITPDDVAQQFGVGPDPERHVEVVKQYLDAGFDHVTLVAIGDDQNAFFTFWSNELRPRLERL